MRSIERENTALNSRQAVLDTEKGVGDKHSVCPCKLSNTLHEHCDNMINRLE